jgi:uncharacterized protein
MIESISHSNYHFYVRHRPNHTIVLRIPDYQVCFLDKSKTSQLTPGIHQHWQPAFPMEWKNCSRQNEKSVQITWDNQFQSSWSWQQLYIIATGQCNLACHYCAQAKGEAGNMPSEMMIAHTEEFLQKSHKPEGLIFYGGEPLLNWNAIRKTISLVSRKKPSVEITLFTNGALIDKQIAEFLTRHKIGVILSLDGDMTSHDQARPLRSHKGSYQKCVKGYHLLRETGCMVGISCVIGPHNVGRIVEITKHLCSLQPVNIGMNLLHAPGRSGYYFSPEDGASAIISATKIAAEYGIEIEQVARRLRSFVFEKPRQGDCPACGTRLVVTPDGRYGPCEGAYPFRPEWFFSSREEAKKLSHELAAWPSSSWECSSCPAIGLCGGGCVLDAYLTEGCLAGLDKRTCNLAKAVLDFALEEFDTKPVGHSLNRIISIEEKQQAFSDYLIQKPRPLQSSSLFGERERKL